MARTLYVKRSEAARLQLDKFPSAGPYPCISGMKEKYWGVNALCIKSGNYVYHVDEATYNRALSFHL